MKNAAQFAVSLFLVFALQGNTHAQVRKIVSGDVLFYEGSVPSQLGNNDIVFTQKNTRTLTVNINDNGDRIYSWKKNGEHYESRDQYFTITSSKGKDIEEKSRAKMLPQDNSLTKWTVSWVEPVEKYGLTDFSFDVTKEAGPEFSLLVDGKEVSVKTTLYRFVQDYFSSGKLPWIIQQEVLYSEDLNEIVLEKLLNIRRQGMFLNSGRLWILKSVKSGKKGS